MTDKEMMTRQVACWVADLSYRGLRGSDGEYFESLMKIAMALKEARKRLRQSVADEIEEMWRGEEDMR